MLAVGVSIILLYVIFILLLNQSIFHKLAVTWLVTSAQVEMHIVM